VKKAAKIIIFLFDAAISKVPLAETNGSKVKRSNLRLSVFMSKYFDQKIWLRGKSESAEKRGT
jgi:hypothetical protein